MIAGCSWSGSSWAKADEPVRWEWAKLFMSSCICRRIKRISSRTPLILLVFAISRVINTKASSTRIPSKL